MKRNKPVGLSSKLRTWVLRLGVAVGVSTGMMVGLTGCDKLKTLVAADEGCGDIEALMAVQSQLQKGVLSATKPYLLHYTIDPDTLRGLVSQLKIELTDIRTQPKPQPTCAATLKISLNPDWVNGIDSVLVANGEAPLKQVALLQDITLNDNELSYDIEYSLQTTDNGQKKIATLVKANALQNFLAKFVVDASLLSTTLSSLDSGEGDRAAMAASAPNVVASTVVVEDASASDEPDISADASTDLPAVNRGPAVSSPDISSNASQEAEAEIIATTARAQAEISARRKAFNQMWNAASPEAQASLTDDQKQWVEQRDATCSDEAANADTGYEEATRLQCMSRMLSERYDEVKDYFDNYE